ncbi:MAG: hypothetical protein COA49_10065 [Bacteroidetes bacterium]|nr:MAG: hypothetical protein COA49_10065 [Bacteroidota bacterium]
MKSVHLIATLVFFASVNSALAQSDIQLRIIGGPLVDEGAAVIPLTNSTYVLGSTSSHATGTVRGYIINYDEDFQFAWSLLTPYGSPIEKAIDGWGYVPEGNGDITVMTRRLGDNESYNIVLHTIKSLGESGEIVSTQEIVHPLNQEPVAAIKWRGSRWAVGSAEGDGWLIDIDDPLATLGASFTTWGHPVRTEKVESARVYNDTLVVTGTTEIDGTLQSTIWAWDSNGTPIWARISPDTVLIGDNVANDIALGPEGYRLLYSFDRPDLPIGHGIMNMNTDNGTPGVPVSTSGDVFVEGCKMMWAGDNLIKLATIDYNQGAGPDILISRLGEFGGYLDSGILGTSFDDTPSNLTMDSQGRIWIIGTTHGFLNGSASICVYRLENSDVIPEISSTTPGLGIKNDPMFFNSVGISDQTTPHLSLFPNPISRSQSISIKGASENVVWTIYSISGKKCLSGTSSSIDCGSLSSGSYIVNVAPTNYPQQISRLPLHVLD